MMQPATQSAADTQRRAALVRMKWTATLLLVLMTIIFVVTWLVPPAPWIGYLRAFTEAAMVGALADWFAVTALFRHPLGIPIPHTAIIPKGKDQLGDALARFVRQNFLTPEVLRPRIEQVDFAHRLGIWLQREGNSGPRCAGRRRPDRLASQNGGRRFHPPIFGREPSGKPWQHQGKPTGRPHSGHADRRRTSSNADG